MPTLNELAKIKNLNKAWDRILSGANYKYKKYFRDMYNTYDVAIEKNLAHLSERLAGRSYNPQKPIIMYEPKPSGFIRPISLLTIEDQIVYQAIANLYVEKYSVIRKKFELSTVFSNILDREINSVFLFKKWIDSYNDFQIQSQNLFLAGSQWMMEFDLAAFYDCISHDILIRKLLPRKQNSLKELIEDCLEEWTSPLKTLQKGHGIPQGPIASDFLAEILLHNIDESLKHKKIDYLRYVDDFRFFGFNKYVVLNFLHETDVLCKKHGLIPQNSKITIRKIKSINDFKTFDASGDPDDDSDDIVPLESDEAEKLFFESVNDKTGDVLSKSNFKYVLKRSPSNSRIKRFLLNHLTKNLHFTEEIFTFFENYIGDTQILNRTKGLTSNRFDFVRGHAWFYLGKSIDSFKPSQLITFINYAKIEVKKDKDNLIARMGAMLFLIQAESKGHGNLSNFILSEPTWLNKATLANELPHRLFSDNQTIKNFFGRNHFEPSMMLGPVLHNLNLTPRQLGIKSQQLKSQTKNVYKEIGIIRGDESNSIDPIGEILSVRYGITNWNKWKNLLASEYDHALGILKQGDRLYLKSKDKWLTDQDAFNNTVFLRLVEFLRSKQMTGGNVSLTHPDGKMKNFGTLTSTSNMNDFVRSYPTISSKLQKIHERRNNLPGTHPYSLKNFTRTKPLLEKERNELTSDLAELYSEIINQFDSLL